MIKNPRYVCIYCDLSIDQKGIIVDHIKEHHNVEKVKQVDSKRTVWLG